MTGDASGDVFVFDGATDSAVGALRDRITDFEQGSDQIDISAIASFAFIGSAAFSGTSGPELRAAGNATANRTTISGDVDGDGNADFQISLDGGFALHEADFIL